MLIIFLFTGNLSEGVLFKDPEEPIKEAIELEDFHASLASSVLPIERKPQVQPKLYFVVGDTHLDLNFGFLRCPFLTFILSPSPYPDLRLLRRDHAIPLLRIDEHLQDVLLAYIKVIGISQHDIKKSEELEDFGKIPLLLYQLIFYYHSLPKTDLKALEIRKILLFNICGGCLFYLSRTNSLDIFDLLKAAAAKYGYLDRLQSSMAFFQKKGAFSTFIETYLLGTNKSLTSKSLPDGHYYRQALDPYQSDDPVLDSFFETWIDFCSIDHQVPSFLMWLEQFKRLDKPRKVIQSKKDLLVCRLNFKNLRIWQDGRMLDDGKYDFVVSGSGEFYASQIIKHLGFFSGKPLAGAGEFNIIAGKITLINDNSGHYQPRIMHTLQTVRILLNEGVFEETAVVSYIDTQRLIEGKSPPYSRQLIIDFIKNPPYEPGQYATWRKGVMSLAFFSAPSLVQAKEEIYRVIRERSLRQWIKRHRDKYSQKRQLTFFSI